MTAEEKVHVFECSKLVSDNFTQEAVTAAYVEALAALRAQAEAENKPLTLDELREIGGEPVWCNEYQCYGIVKVETIGHWANKPFLVGARHVDFSGVAVDFEYDIEKRELTLYRHKPKEGTT